MPKCPARAARQRFDQLGLRGLASTRAGDGPVAAAPPALVSLAEFIVVAAPGHVAHVGPVFADNVDIGPGAARQPRDRAFGRGRIAVVLLHEDIVLLLRIERTGILRVHIAPGGTMQNEFNGGCPQVEHHQPPGDSLLAAVAQERAYGQAVSVRRDGRERIDAAGAKLRARKGESSTIIVRRSLPSSPTRFKVNRPPPTLVSSTK